MESPEVQAALGAAVEDVLETMCFACVIGSSDQPPTEPGLGASPVIAELRFIGSPSGGFRLGVEAQVARLFAAAFLGREESELSEVQTGEVVCELANMICGSVLSRLERDITFHITHPELASPEAAADARGTVRWFELEEGLLNTSLLLEQVP